MSLTQNIQAAKMLPPCYDPIFQAGLQALVNREDAQREVYVMEEELMKLIAAARCGDLDEVRNCCSTGILNAEGPLGLTALGEACRAEHTDVMKFLIEAGADVGDVLHLACEYKCVDTVNVLVANGVSADRINKYGYTPLHIAAERMNLQVLEALLKHGASVDMVDRQYRQSALHIACKTECLAAVRALLAFGAKTNVKDSSSHTPLHVACSWNKSLNVVLALLDNGAPIDEKDRYGDTPLHIACDRGRLDMVRLLLQHGASFDIYNKRHLTPLRLAFEYDQIIILLLDYGAGMHHCTCYACQCKTTVLLCEYENHCRCAGHVDMFEKHFIKVKTADLCYTAKHQWDPIDSERWGQQDRELFSAKCSAELEKMRTRKIGDSDSTYYDLLCRRKSALRNEKIVGNLQSEVLQEFPIYRDLIYCSYMKIPECLRRHELLEKCGSFFELTQFSHLPIELEPLILDYLSNVDLENLVEICETSRRKFGSEDIGSQNLARDREGSDVTRRLRAMSISKCSII